MIAIPTGGADASSYCGSGGTCLFVNNSYSSSQYWNATGVISNLTTYKYQGTSTSLNNTSSAWADSTSSSTFSGVDFFDATSCSSKLFWLPRGSQFKVADGTDPSNDKISSFKLSKPGVTTTC